MKRLILALALVAATGCSKSPLAPTVSTSAATGWLDGMTGFSFADFRGGNHMTWLVTPENLQVFRYAITGKTMMVALEIVNSQMGGEPYNQFILPIPGHLNSAVTTRNPATILDNGQVVSGHLAVVPNGTAILVQRDDLQRFSGVGSLTVNGQLQFELTTP